MWLTWLVSWLIIIISKLKLYLKDFFTSSHLYNQRIACFEPYILGCKIIARPITEGL